MSDLERYGIHSIDCVSLRCCWYLELLAVDARLSYGPWPTNEEVIRVLRVMSNMAASTRKHSESYTGVRHCTIKKVSHPRK